MKRLLVVACLAVLPVAAEAVPSWLDPSNRFATKEDEKFVTPELRTALVRAEMKFEPGTLLAPKRCAVYAIRPRDAASPVTSFSIQGHNIGSAFSDSDIRRVTLWDVRHPETVVYYYFSRSENDYVHPRQYEKREVDPDYSFTIVVEKPRYPAAFDALAPDSGAPATWSAQNSSDKYDVVAVIHPFFRDSAVGAGEDAKTTCRKAISGQQADCPCVGTFAN